MEGFLRDLADGMALIMGGVISMGTLLGTSRNPHWFVRGWEFPRLQIFFLGCLSFLGLMVFWGGRWFEWAVAGALGASLLWQAYNILPFTPIWKKSVVRAASTEEGRTFRLVISNVLMTNDKYDRWLEVVRSTDPDVILAVEVDQTWMEHIAELEEDYPHVLRYVQDNYYGMVVFSRLEFRNDEIRFLVQEDVPSMRTDIRLPAGDWIEFHAVHPRPPEPLQDQDSVARDAEIVLLGREIKDDDYKPRVIGGDFNDVAWSRTTDLFLKLSRLLDPRRGRGFYNTYDARRWYFRYPLDHIFHSKEFELVELRRLPNVGSDHFPVFVELAVTAEGPREQPTPRSDSEDEKEADEKVQRAVEAKSE